MITPDPIAFSLFGLEVRWYGVLIASALLLGLFISARRAKKYGLDQELIIDFFLYMTPAIIIGARLYYVVFSYDYYVVHPEEIFATWHGGLAIHGGIIAGILVAIVFSRFKKINFFTLADVLIPALPLGQAIGRWGNYLNQEAYGAQTDLTWAITVNDAALGIIKVHPTFLYESIWNLLVFGFLFYYEDKLKKVDGELLFVYLGLYSIGRFFIEGLRTDSLMFMGLRTAQLISLALVAVGVGGLWYLRKNQNRFGNNLIKKK